MVELCLNHIENMPTLLEYIKPEKRNKKKVLITQIYPGSSLSKSLIILPGNVIKSINNKNINTISDVRKAINNPILKNSKKYLKIESEDNKILILSMENSLKENLFLSQSYNFPITKLNGDIIKMEYLNANKKKTTKKSVSISRKISSRNKRIK